MRTFLQQKLWRDKMIERAEKNYGSIINWRYLNDQEFKNQLLIKLQEEVAEVVSAHNREHLIIEIADMYEVIDALLAIHNITKNEVFAQQEQKRNEYGGFTSRKFIETATHPVGSGGEKYCLNDPEKYPEIIIKKEAQ